MAKPELGAKRTCQACGSKYYDLMRDPIVCPKCGVTFVATVIAPSAASLRAAAKAEAARKAVVEKDDANEDEADNDTISLEDADDEATGGVKDDADPDVDVDVDGDADGDDEDDAETFLEPDEDSDDDVTEIIGDREKDEET